jgi:hypothetical protein
MLSKINKVAVWGRIAAVLPLALWVLCGFLPEHFNYNDDLAGYTGPGQVIHGGEWEFPWSTPICLLGGIGAVVMGWKHRKVIPVLEGLWCCLVAHFFYRAYPLYVHFT